MRHLVPPPIAQSPPRILLLSRDSNAYVLELIFLRVITVSNVHPQGDSIMLHATGPPSHLDAQQDVTYFVDSQPLILTRPIQAIVHALSSDIRLPFLPNREAMTPLPEARRIASVGRHEFMLSSIITTHDMWACLPPELIQASFSCSQLAPSAIYY